MPDYVSVMLNGLFTGLGVILAQRIIAIYDQYKGKVDNKFINNDQHQKGNKY